MNQTNRVKYIERVCIMILASAIKYKIHKTGEEVVLCGARHGDIFKQLKGLGFEAGKGYKQIAQGFIDHKNNFLTREEAYEHAKMCGQICDKIIYERENNNIFDKEMISEDLW